MPASVGPGFHSHFPHPKARVSETEVDPFGLTYYDDVSVYCFGDDDDPLLWRAEILCFWILLVGPRAVCIFFALWRPQSTLLILVVTGN